MSPVLLSLSPSQQELSPLSDRRAVLSNYESDNGQQLTLAGFAGDVCLVSRDICHVPPRPRHHTFRGGDPSGQTQPQTPAPDRPSASGQESWRRFVLEMCITRLDLLCGNTVTANKICRKVRRETISQEFHLLPTSQKYKFHLGCCLQLITLIRLQFSNFSQLAGRRGEGGVTIHTSPGTVKCYHREN